ncbi:hypothetical protein [Myceligenerans pegani]|uniref:MmyB-like transcription regulator ligand binding domain-containing protein n=1 Tax=Myceligenerans pegani TaxID=2776917 RepID=A0ABR9N5S6_9MICO|nr:hypothetical protein [Myceligenerans sp. TRM 65318]MBE3021288.1 hypothetical protein [Myceligenerans sp. TRM 65318]
MACLRCRTRAHANCWPGSRPTPDCWQISTKATTSPATEPRTGRRRGGSASLRRRPVGSAGPALRELPLTSPDFRRWWSEHQVDQHRHGTKRLDHPVAGGGGRVNIPRLSEPVRNSAVPLDRPKPSTHASGGSQAAKWSPTACCRYSRASRNVPT